MAEKKTMREKLMPQVEKEISKCNGISDFDDRLKCKSTLLHEITEVQDVTNINIMKDMDASLSDATTDPRWVPAHMVDNANAIILGITDGRFRPDIFWHTGAYVNEKMDSLISKQWLLLKDVPDSIKEKIKKRDEK